MIAYPATFDVPREVGGMGWSLSQPLSAAEKARKVTPSLLS